MKKFLLFIVEGKNDEREINAILHTPSIAQKIEEYVVVFLPHNGDITTETKTTPDNIRGRLDKMVSDWRRNDNTLYRSIKTSEIQEIIHILDVDGVFISKENILDDKNAFKPRYVDNGILTNKRSDIIGRNLKKAAILQKLSQIETIDNIPYSAYYFSCNMDHLLTGERNPAQNVKDSFSREFCRLCRDNPECLNKTVFSEEFGSIYDYPLSWQFIQKGLNSLNRQTNFNLLFTDNAKHTIP